MRRNNPGSYEITSFFDGAQTEEVRAFVPAPLPPQPPIDLSGMQGILAEANIALGRLDAEARNLPDADLFLYHYVRREALLSSQIEGTQSSLSDLLLFEVEADGDPPALTTDAREVSNYIAAINHGWDQLEGDRPLINRYLREMHAKLLRSGRGSDKHPGEFRRSQNWIGGSRPGNAIYVPPPHSAVEDCMGNLERFIHADDDGLPAVVRAGVAHAQFETIHPFLDGNGRIGRLMIALILRWAGVIDAPVLYLSLYLKRERAKYYDLLGQLRVNGDWEAWLEFFIEGVRETAEDGVATARRLIRVFEADRERIAAAAGHPNSALRVLEVFRQRPMNAISDVASELDITFPTVSTAIDKLVDLGILSEVTGRRRGRVFGYAEYIDILSEGAEPL